jgi:hypothetical protein
MCTKRQRGLSTNGFRTYLHDAARQTKNDMAYAVDESIELSVPSDSSP